MKNEHLKRNINKAEVLVDVKILNITNRKEPHEKFKSNNKYNNITNPTRDFKNWEQDKKNVNKFVIGKRVKQTH